MLKRPDDPAQPLALKLKESPQMDNLPAAPRPAMTPMEMLSRAVEDGKGIEYLDKLMTLQERWQTNQARQAYDAAIAAAKAEIPVIAKNRKVDFTSARGRTNYEYEDLAEIARSIDPILGKNGLSYRFRSTQDGNTLVITCIMSHRDGHSEENSLSAKNDESGNKNAIQAIGSTATYLQRYTLKLALGLAAAKDDDGQAADAPRTISDAQTSELIALSDAAEADKSKFCQHFGIEGIAQLPAAKFAQAKTMLQTKVAIRARATAQAKDAENADH